MPNNAYNVIANALTGFSTDKYNKASNGKALSAALKMAERVGEMPDYDAMLPNKLGIEPKVYKEKSQEELLKEAQNLVGENYKEKIEKVENGYKNKVNSLSQKSENKKQVFSEKTDKATQKHEMDTENAKFKAIKNGLANSSVIDEYLENLNKNYIDNISVIANEYAIFKENIENEIQLALNAKTQALMIYDIKAASDIEKKVNILRNEQTIAIEDVNKYNKQLFVDKQNFDSDREDTLEQLKKAWEITQKRLK